MLRMCRLAMGLRRYSRNHRKSSLLTEQQDVNLIIQSRVPLIEALWIIKALSITTPQADVALNIQCKSDDSSVRDLRGTVVLPEPFLKIRTLVFATGKAAEEAIKAGADIVGGDELVALVWNVVSTHLQRSKKINWSSIGVSPHRPCCLRW